jgi:protein tyrosine phosphatase (PTP) superfamily phosphohydrolase (DUF442 family)
VVITRAPREGPDDLTENSMAQMDRTRRRIRRRLVWLSVLLCLSVVSVYTFRRPLFSGNFGVVDPGRVYRSAQPDRGLAELLGSKQLGSVLNLRGGSHDDPWYSQEVRLTRQFGVDFYDFPMSATRRPSRAELLVLLDLFGRCRYPLLIHCKSGSDRTALASALYLMAVKGIGPDRAGAEFSLDYGHVPLAGTQRLHEPFDEYRRWLSDAGLAHSPERFRGWVEHEYRSDPPTNVLRPLQPGPRQRLAEGQLSGAGPLERR